MSTDELVREIGRILPAGMEAYGRVEELSEELRERNAKLECFKCEQEKDASEVARNQGMCDRCVRLTMEEMREEGYGEL